jgi:hypothetical protein
MTLRELVDAMVNRHAIVCPTPNGSPIGVPHMLGLMPDGDWHVEYTLPCGTPGWTTLTPGFAQDDPQDVRLTPR